MATARNTSFKTARLETRVSQDQKELIERAAAYLGRSVSDFISSEVELAAKRIIDQYERLHLDREQSRALVEALLAPKRPNKRLREAVGQHSQRVTSR
jgi:uncharacterized protein (DUF1778 family)